MIGAHGVLDLDGARVHVSSWGTGPPIVCLHGLGGGAHFFQTLGLALADRYRTVALDFPGSGLSAARPSCALETFGALVTTLVRHESLDPLALVGHSMGTIVGLEAFRRSPRIARGLVAVGGLPDAQPESRARIAERAGRIRRSGLAGLGEEAAAANLSVRTRHEQPAVAALFGRLFEMQSAEGYVATAGALTTWTAPPLPPLDGVSCLLVSGDEDGYAPPTAMRRFQAALPPGTVLEILSGCGHLPFFEHPQAFAAIIRRFLDRLAGRDAARG